MLTAPVGRLNYFDILQAQGKYQNQPPFPFVLGAEFAGRIAANSPIPPGCPYKRGDRVFGAAQGSYADKVAANWNQLLPVPKSLTFRQAAGLFVTWPTSYEALTGRAQLKPGEWCLVHAGAGGVGLCAIQIAKALGAKVIATASTPAKREVCTKHGKADHAIDYTKPGWQQEVMKITGGKGVDSLKCIAWKGRALVIGFAAGQIEKLPLNLVLLKNISIVGTHWGAYAKFDKGRQKEVWADLFALLESGSIQPVVYDEQFTLEQVSEALVALEQRKTWGKAILTVREEDGQARL
ncbi:SubName: Full=Related to quinone reductase {ECO:0000313/EMBL:CCA67581.1} [Serendipita indica DSM 11827]|uniref:Related to quinone reductase n=1 Tax=Serendipita indica (strain DSM 11827) TaxID=1109443 RepID=G4T8C8_SERID|nr:SubName: Full=Related to quinone reductase {ECO:0000313/EMBL:CCA67581.1} [Serendipita indica DSM 11827]CCA67581.1 related to quinone reductase [Serendipita indica DSM 11827]